MDTKDIKNEIYVATDPDAIPSQTKPFKFKVLHKEVR